MRRLLPAKAWTIATLLAAAACALAASPAMAGAYSCRVPRAILCEGCAKQIAIALLGDGSCRISFAPPAGADAPSAAPLPGELNIEVEVAPAPKPKAAAIRRSARWPRANRVAAGLARPRAPEARCFVFNEHRYCE
jgi:hypothetical protein